MREESSQILKKPPPETLRNTMKLLMIYNGRFQRERMNPTLKTARLNRCSRASQPISGARVVCHVWPPPLFSATCSLSVCRS